MDQITGRLIAAARTLLGMAQAELAERAKISVPTLKRMEASDGPAVGMANNVDAVRALETAGVDFVNGGIRPRNDKAYGHLHDDQGIVGFIKDGELRNDRDGTVLALVKDYHLHDPETGEKLAPLGQLGVFGNPLPDVLKSKLK
jgi:transcriptional regulator with XRE-family HTH domain